nr:PAS domain S-box protein [Desulfobacula sp.]
MIFLLFGLYSLYVIRAASDLTRTIFNHPLATSNATLQANGSIIKMHRSMKDIVLSNSLDEIQKSIAEVDRQEQLVYQYLDIVRDRILGDEGKNLEKESRTLFENWRPIRKEVIALVYDGQRDKATEITTGKSANHVAKIEEKMIVLTDCARTNASLFMNEAEKSQSNLSISAIGSFVLFLTVSLIITFFTLKRTASAERELTESRQLLVNAIDYAPIGMVLVEPGGNFYKTNQAFNKMIGYSEEELKEKSFQNIIHPDDYEIGSNAIKQLIEGEIDKIRIEERYVRKDGTIINVLLTSSLLKDYEGKPQYFFTQVQDITEHKLAEQHIINLNRVLRSIRDVNQLIVRERDTDTLIREGCRLLVDNRGYASALIVLTDQNGKPVSWAGSGLASSSESLNAMLESHEMPSCCSADQLGNEIVLIDNRDDVCSKCLITHGCPETHSLCVRLIHEEVCFGYLVVALNHNLSVDDEERSLFAEMAGDLAYALNFLRIETDHRLLEDKRKNLENQLAQAQKMESIGRLAGGVAHDYNNISSIIIGYSEFALEKAKPGDSLHEDLTEILNAAKRSTDITRQLLAFARRQTIAPKVLDLNDIIGKLIKMIQRLIGEDIDLAWLPGAEVWPVKIDPSQIDQIIANLSVNARDAITDVGKLTIETENICFNEEYCADHAGFVPGDFVLLAISDDGCGIEPDILDKIFEPFFTTKELGKGTGLGLATVYGIVKQNDGFINIYSEPKKGTTIKIYLPRYKGQAVKAYSDNKLEIPLSRGETVLLVEDNSSILKLGRRMLKELGYIVLSASSPREAIELAKEQAGEINLLITDVIMPGMNGRELSEHLQSFYPNLKILFMSGYTANVIAHRGVLDDDVFFMSKPFSKNDMAVKVRQVLDEGKG